MTDTSTNSTALAAASGLEAQIRQFTDFSTELVSSGTSIKKIMSDIEAKSADLWQVKPEDIYIVPGYNPRVHNTAYFDGIRAMAANMAASGYMQDKPMAVYFAKIDGVDRMCMQDGHRRHGAVMIAKSELGAPIKTVPIVVKPKSMNQIDLLKEMLHANEGEPFRVYEKAVIAKRFKSFGWTDKQIADEMGCTTVFVGQLLTLAGAPQAIQELVDNGQVSATMAFDVLKEHGEDAANVLQAAVSNAKSKGKSKATAKDIPTAADQKARNAKKVAFDLYKALKKLRDDPAIEKKMDDKLIETIDALFATVEKVKKAKPAPAPKPIKVKKAAAPKKEATKAVPAKKTPKNAKQAKAEAEFARAVASSKVSSGRRSWE